MRSGVRGGLITHGKAREVSIEAVITRADGRVERVGQVAYWHRNPLRRIWNRIIQQFKRI
jgi:hypothetical protein